MVDTGRRALLQAHSWAPRFVSPLNAVLGSEARPVTVLKGLATHLAHDMLGAFEQP